MGLIDASPPMKWGWVKIISVLLCILIIVGVFLPWFWVEGKAQVLGQEKIDHYDSIGINDYPASYPIIFSALFCLFFIFFNYDINIDMGNKPRRINELFPIIFAFLVFVYCISLASKINEEISKYSNYPTSAGESVTVLGKTYTASVIISGGVGTGFVLIATCSFLLMIFSFLLWMQKSQGTVTAATPTPSQVSPPTVPKQVEKRLVTPAPVSLSKEESVTVFSKIPGITIKKATLLYNAGYKSFSDLRTASPDKLLSIKGITLKDVENIKKEIEF
ncbi:MAG: helix-hairpin-helix domain-containing protein [Candidatus Thermoplasmatota archaeon]|nr:helix-hairpin-helix domain-containing protein [Candidatus Thermoplasmatota archaeon]MCG2825490.1 helix-hairpin-helix domain-containing protein [Thermoplasmatales archaeon]